MSEGFAIVPEELIGSSDIRGGNRPLHGHRQSDRTGKPLDVPVVHVWEIRDGKVLARFRQFIEAPVRVCRR